jgi:hypothetical protein
MQTALRPVAKPAMIILIAAIVGIITSASVVSMANARGHWTNASGTIASIQNDKNGKPAWILSGDWNFRNVQYKSPSIQFYFPYDEAEWQ